MNVTALRVGTVEISLTAGFEAQGFAVTDVTGLSDYGEHKMGVPGSNDIVISGSVLPGHNPMSIRTYLFSSTNPFTPILLEAEFQNGIVYQALGAITSVKCGINEAPTTIVVTIRKRGCWYGIPRILYVENIEGEVNHLNGVFEYKAPVTLEIQLTSFFSRVNLQNTNFWVSLGVGSSIYVNFNMIDKVLPQSLTGLFDGSVVRITNSLDYHACLITDGVVYDLPVLGKVVSGMVPPSTSPLITFQENIPAECSISIAITTRETYLTI